MSDGDKRNKKCIQQKVGTVKNGITNVSDVFQSVWIRRIIQNYSRFDGLILENRYNFLFHFNTILFALFILKFKK